LRRQPVGLYKVATEHKKMYTKNIYKEFTQTAQYAWLSQKFAHLM